MIALFETQKVCACAHACTCTEETKTKCYFDDIHLNSNWLKKVLHLNWS